MSAHSEYTGEFISRKPMIDDRQRNEVIDVVFEGIGEFMIDYQANVLYWIDKWNCQISEVQWNGIEPEQSELEQIKDQLKEIIEEREESYMKRWDYPTLVFDHAWTGELPF